MQMKRKRLNVGDFISTFSMSDNKWSQGEVVSLDQAGLSGQVLYQAGEREVHFSAVKYKMVHRKSSKRPLRGIATQPLNNDAQQLKELLTDMSQLLFEFEAKLFSVALMRAKLEWRQTWRASVQHATEFADFPLMRDAVSQIALLSKAHVIHPGWHERLSNASTAAELKSLVLELMKKTVIWKSPSVPDSSLSEDGNPRPLEGEIDTERFQQELAQTPMAGQETPMEQGVVITEENRLSKGNALGVKVEDCEQACQNLDEDKDVHKPSTSNRISVERSRKSWCGAGDHVNTGDVGPRLRSKAQEKRKVEQSRQLDLHNVESRPIAPGLSRVFKSLLESDSVNPAPDATRSDTEANLTNDVQVQSEEPASSASIDDDSVCSGDEDSTYHTDSSEVNGLHASGRRYALRIRKRIRGKQRPDELRSQSKSSNKRRQRTRTCGEGAKKSGGDLAVLYISASDHSGDEREAERQCKDNASMSKVLSTGKKRGRPVPKKAAVSPHIDLSCAVCQFAGAAVLMLLCDNHGCELAFHTFCLQPPLQSIPENDWHCPHCLIPPTLGSKMAKDIFASKDLEKVIGRRAVKPDVDSSSLELEYLVKWRTYSHKLDSWVPEDWLSYYDRTRLLAFQRKYPLTKDKEEISVDLRREEWSIVDRVIGSRPQWSAGHSTHTFIKDHSSDRLEYLVKWVGIEYDGATWEADVTDEMLNAISMFEKRHEKADSQLVLDRHSSISFASLKQQPDYVDGGILHSYQLSGLKWLLSNFQARKSVILADEMGLGKTIQAAVFMLCARLEGLADKPFLVIAPKSTLSGWEQELRKWASALNCIVYHGDKGSRHTIQKYEFYTNNKKPLFDVLVTSYELAMVDNSLLQKFGWSAIIVDEGHRIKNDRCKLSSLLKRQKAEFRVLLTGTPVQNTLAELFTLLHFLDPIEFPDPDKAACKFGQVDAISTNTTKDTQSMHEQVTRIHELLQPRMLRRLKAEVLRDMLPGKKLVEVSCALSPYQRQLYVAILKKNYKLLNKGVHSGQKRSLNSILVDLKMCCNHPFLFPGKEPKHLTKEEEYRCLVDASGKFQLLDKLLPLLKKEGHRVLLFSQMKKMLDIMEDFLTFLGLSFCRIDGSTSAADRVKQITAFNSPESSTFMFLISTRAGGLGINLPSADTVIIYDPDFNPFVDLQAQARAHRIGQVNTVLVYQLVTKCSVEEKILQRSRKKLAMENLVMSSAAKETSVDLNELLLHGAKTVLDEHNLEATSRKFNDEDLKQLLNRDMLQNADHGSDTTGYLGAIQTPDDDISHKTSRADVSEWDELLGGLAEHGEIPEELGRGKRSRRMVKYEFEPNLEVDGEEEEEYQVSDSSESSGSEASLDPEATSKLGRCRTNTIVDENEVSSFAGEFETNDPGSSVALNVGGLAQGSLLRQAAVTLDGASIAGTQLRTGHNQNGIHQGQTVPIAQSIEHLESTSMLNSPVYPYFDGACHGGQGPLSLDPIQHYQRVLSFVQKPAAVLEIPPASQQGQAVPVGAHVNPSQPSWAHGNLVVRQAAVTQDGASMAGTQLRTGDSQNVSHQGQRVPTTQRIEHLDPMSRFNSPAQSVAGACHGGQSSPFLDAKQHAHQALVQASFVQNSVALEMPPISQQGQAVPDGAPLNPQPELMGVFASFRRCVESLNISTRACESSVACDLLTPTLLSASTLPHNFSASSTRPSMIGKIQAVHNASLVAMSGNISEQTSTEKPSI